MPQEIPMVRATFRLRIRCHNCRHVSRRILQSPDIADAPADVEELRESALMQNQVYGCDKCDNPIATIVGVTQISELDDLDRKAMEAPAPRPIHEVLRQPRRRRAA